VSPPPFKLPILWEAIDYLFFEQMCLFEGIADRGTKFLLFFVDARLSFSNQIPMGPRVGRYRSTLAAVDIFFVLLLTLSIGLYCTVLSLKVCNKVALFSTLFYFIAHFSTSSLGNVFKV
jgi:hypothetical protein